MSGTIRTRDQKVLALRSGGRCAMPDCRAMLVQDRTTVDREAIVGEMAHIRGEKPGAARYDSNMPDEERNSYDNLIFLCVRCHTVIDKQVNTYTVDLLHKIKSDHENWVRGSLQEAMLDVSFVELEFLTKLLLSESLVGSGTLVLTPPPDKIEKNGLSDDVSHMITLGMAMVDKVQEYIVSVSKLDMTFGQKLRMGFVREYERLREEGFSGDDLFHRLHHFASSGKSPFKMQAAGLAILAYFFEVCEVFEP